MNWYKIIIISIILFLISPHPVISQEEQIRYKVEVKEKLLYVVAVDKKGNPVTDLKKDDFQLFVDDELRKINTFTLITHTSRALKEKEIAPKQFKESAVLAGQGGLNRRFILAIIPDRFNHFYPRYRRWREEQALRHLIENAQYPEDWIGIIALYKEDYLSKIKTIQDFTWSKDKLLKKMDAFFKIENKKLSILQSQFPLTTEELNQVPHLPIFHGLSPPIRGKQIIPALKYIAEKMSVLQGRKIILCLGLPLNCLGTINEIDQFFEMIDKMLAHNITIYYSEMRGPRMPNYFGPSSSIKLSNGFLPGDSRYYPFGATWGYLLYESSHFALANETGGKYYHNISSPTYFIDNITKMNRSYYLVSFNITEDLKKKQSNSFKLKCKRKGIKLYYGNKYYAPDELDEKIFEESYERIQLYKYLFLDTKKEPSLKLYGNWIRIPSNEDQLALGFVDFYLSGELFHKLPISYQLGCSYLSNKYDGISFQDKLNFENLKKDVINQSYGYVVRALTKMPVGKKKIRQAAMNCETGEYGRFDMIVSKRTLQSNFSRLILGRLLDEGFYYEYREESEERFNFKKKLYDLLSIKKRLVIPAVNNTFNSGEPITFCLINKIPKKQSKRYKKHKVIAYLSPDREGEITETILPVRIKKVEKHYRQYYGSIDTSKLAAGKYRLEIDIKDAHNTLISATDAIFEIIQ